MEIAVIIIGFRLRTLTIETELISEMLVYLDDLMHLLPERILLKQPFISYEMLLILHIYYKECIVSLFWLISLLATNLCTLNICLYITVSTFYIRRTV